ncbi:MAG: hypothetical protein IMW97_08210 [Firmicutes bacterium]|nr:hypothetical protein [Candidatus Fermentithermobacillaceae bacterium]
MRFGLGILLAVTLLMSTCFGCSGRLPEKSEGPVPALPPGEELVVWDMKQPHFPGSRPYEEEVQRVCEEFQKKTGIPVKLVFVSRWELPDALLKAKRESKLPDVLFSGEFPCLTGLERDLAGLLNSGQYQEAAIAAWTRGGRIVGIPSAVLWLGIAARKDALNSQQPGQSGDLGIDPSTVTGLLRSLAVLPTSEAFMEIATRDLSGRYRSPREIASFVSWIKMNVPQFPAESCLERFKRGEVWGIYGATPYSFKWLRISSEPGSSGQPVLGPLVFQGGDVGFRFTVPGYVILSGSEAKMKASAELGKLLAENHGRWGARALGLIPARIEDLPIFTLESGFTREERSCLLRSLGTTATGPSPQGQGAGRGNAPANAAPDDLFTRYKRLEQLAGVLSSYFSGDLTDDELVEEIARVLEGNTNR